MKEEELEKINKIVSLLKKKKSEKGSLSKDETLFLKGLFCVLDEKYFDNLQKIENEYKRINNQKS